MDELSFLMRNCENTVNAMHRGSISRVIVSPVAMLIGTRNTHAAIKSQLNIKRCHARVKSETRWFAYALKIELSRIFIFIHPPGKQTTYVGIRQRLFIHLVLDFYQYYAQS